jgi:iron complex outermembrane receptor protein
MLYSNSVRPAPGLRSALALALFWALPALAASDDALPPVVVTATRSAQPLHTTPVGATVITAEQIARSGVADANEAIRKLGGIVGRTDLFGGRESVLDLRGYGDTASANTVVLVDGIRISENELVPARLSAVPLDQIERIEIVRGGNSVLWGEGATSGVINIILKQGGLARTHTRLSASVASFGGNDLQLSTAQQVGALALDASAQRVRSEGHRDHSVFKQDSVNAGMQFGDGVWTQRFRVQQEAQSAQWAGSLSFAEFAQNPRQANASSLNSHGRTDEGRFNSNTELRQGDVTWQLDLASRRRNYQSNSYARQVDNQQATPKVSYAARWDEVDVGGVLGMDFQRWRMDTPDPYGPDTAHQTNAAVFWQGQVGLPSQTKLVAGLRSERVHKDEVPLYSSPYDLRRTLNAAELGLNQVLSEQLSLYGRLAKSFRLGNVDENTYTPDGKPLRPQLSRDKELGLRWQAQAVKGAVRVFRQDNTDEIMYAPSPIDGYSYNLNADPTRKQGVELEGQWLLTDALSVRGTWQRLSARYREGVNAGLQQVLVAPLSSTARVSYRFNEHHLVELGVQHLGAMRFGDDNDNQCSRRIPASTLFDARYAWSNEGWTLALAAANLGNQVGYNHAYRCADGGLYPEAGRAFKATVSRQF